MQNIEISGKLITEIKISLLLTRIKKHLLVINDLLNDIEMEMSNEKISIDSIIRSLEFLR